MAPGSPRTVDPASLRRILVRAPNWLGDLCMVAPALEALAAAAPQASFAVACKRSLASLAPCLPRVSDVVVLDPVPGVRGARGGPGRRIRALGCDAAIVVPRSFRAALTVAWARIPIRIGFASDARSPLLTHALRGWKPLRLAHRMAYFGALLRPFGLEAPVAGWRFTPPADALHRMDAWLARAPGRRPGAPLIAFEPGGAYGVAKRWSEAGYATLAGRLVQGGADVVLVGSADMAPLHDRIATAAGVPLLRAAGATDLVELAALLARARVLVTNDTGPMHLAAAVGTPLLALFGSTDPAVCGPRGTGPARVLYEKVQCSPCYLKECPVPGHPCLDQFEVGRVERELATLLAAGDGRVR